MGLSVLRRGHADHQNLLDAKLGRRLTNTGRLAVGEIDWLCKRTQPKGTQKFGSFAEGSVCLENAKK